MAPNTPEDLMIFFSQHGVARVEISCRVHLNIPKFGALSRGFGFLKIGDVTNYTKAPMLCHTCRRTI